jgi:hypothetical protein
MTALGPLASWATELALLAEETVAVFGPWLPTLERLVGPHPLARADARGEPDGFFGLGRRGRYERLVLSEWGMLDAAPEEFLRRAGAGEHLFHQIARTSTAGTERLVVLFDAGPAQLGAPRLVHLALLLLLARRARISERQLCWGVLQAPEAAWRHAGDLRALLAARSTEAAGPAAIAAWATRLGPRTPGEERWLIAGAGSPAALLQASPLLVTEPDQPDQAVLQVQANGPGEVRRTTLLPLPPADSCARLLRAPLATDGDHGRTTADHIVAPGAQLVFSTNGRQLIARLASGAVVALGIPAIDRQVGGILARLVPTAGQEVVAAGWSKGELHVATAGAEEMAIHRGRGRRWTVTTLTGSNRLPRTAPDQLGALIVDREGFWFSDIGWRLYRARRSGHLESFDEVVLTCAATASGFASVGRRDGSGPLELCVRRQAGPDRTVLFPGALRASHGYIALDRHGQVGLVAVSAGDGHWRLRIPTKALVEIQLPPTTEVFGAVSWHGRPSLLVRHAAGTALELIDDASAGARPAPRFSFSGEVRHACLSARGDLIAAQVDGGVEVIDRAGQLRLVWGGIGS